GIHERVTRMLSLGRTLNQVRARSEAITMGTLDLARDVLSMIKENDEYFHSDMQFVPQVEEIIAILERTIDLCRPPAA
ncbi:hypothetical protein PMAYCL1PPCAC_01140, partial [Pristionchus mayeri]